MLKRDLRVGIFLAPFHALDEDTTLAMDRDFELVQFLEKLDYEEAWFGEHHSGGVELYGCPELFIATAAERTQRIKLGTGVISLPYHNPLAVAGRMVQLDHQTRGRAMFGFGPGILNSDAQMMGIKAATQRDRMNEAVDVIIRLLNGEVVTQSSDWFELNGARLHIQPYSRPMPHVAVTSTVTPNGATVAGRHGLGMLCVAAASDAGYSVLDSNWAAACNMAKTHSQTMNKSELRLVAPFHVAETRQQAIDDMAYGYEKFCDYVYQTSPDGPASLGLGTVEEMIESRATLIGSPDDALEQLERYWDKADGFGTMLFLAHNWANFEATKKSYELIARYVLPKFRGSNDWRAASYKWMGDNVEAFTAAREGAVRQTLEKFANQKSMEK